MIPYKRRCGSGSGVEHRLAKARVASSNLVFRSIFIFWKIQQSRAEHRWEFREPGAGSRNVRLEEIGGVVPGDEETRDSGR